MFVVRGIAVSLTFFVLLYCALSAVVALSWRLASRLRTVSPTDQARLLFWLRVFPLIATIAITLALVIPAYVRLEPRSIEEDIALPITLAFGCVALFALGLFRVVTAQRRAAKVVAEWLKGANDLDAGVAAPTFCTNRGTPPLTLVGVRTPRVVVSEATVALLNRDELRVAVQHEVAHMRSRDNLKKLIFYCAPFLGMTGLERAWQEAAELAADDEAVTCMPEALDLAAALIKLSRLIPVKQTPAFTMALVSVHSSVSERVVHLLAWSDARHKNQSGWMYLVPALLATMLCLAALYEPVLTQTHRITELLVR